MQPEGLEAVEEAEDSEGAGQPEHRDAGHVGDKARQRHCERERGRRGGLSE